jgi:hypothetical protein
MKGDPMLKMVPVSKQRDACAPCAATGAPIGRRAGLRFVQTFLLALALTPLAAVAESAVQGDARVERWAEAEGAAASASASAAPRVSPHAIAARQHALAASGGGHSPALPPTLRRTRQAIGQQPSH